MKKKYKVSVIVPVYNVEKYLKQCLESLVNQTLSSIQIIVVNDGSKDNSQEIIDEYVKKYPGKLFGYEKENGGLGDARNYGLLQAEGEYIGFVDSDDWVDVKMFELLYQHAVKEEAQIVISDLYTINDGWEKGTVSKGYRGENPNPEKEDYILYSLDPAISCNKLFYYQLFEITKFPKNWYEDIATIPIIMSYAKKIDYLQIPLYYYRQRQGSITQTVQDSRIRGVIQAWQTVFAHVNKQYVKEIEFSVYKSIHAFFYFKPEFVDEYIEFLKENKTRFFSNSYIINALNSNKLENLLKKELIPKKIHYFWFGNNPKNELMLRCIASWKKYALDYEIIEWNESNCDINECAYVQEAYQAKKWAFVADYFRIKKIYEYGGFYVDTDTEFVGSIAQLRLNRAFFAFETKNSIHAGFFGAIQGMRLVKQWLDTYSTQHFILKDGSYNTSANIVRRLTDILIKKYGAVLNGKKQYLKEDIMIYPPNVLTLEMFDGQCIAQHHYEASWWDVKTGYTSYKYEILKDYFGGNNFMDSQEKELISMLQMTIDQYENSTCWKITKPLRYIINKLRIRKKVSV